MKRGPLNFIAPFFFCSGVRLRFARGFLCAAADQPVDPDGNPLNFNFEEGTLKDWDAVGSAFENQPVHGDVVHARRQDTKSRHHGNYWVGTYEVVVMIRKAH